MDQELLRYLLAAFPGNLPEPLPESGDDYRMIRYRVPFETGFARDTVAGIDCG